MKPEHAKWIADKLSTCQKPVALGMCAEWTLAMQQAFPDLQRVRGHVYLRSGLERQHWWLVDSEGTIVDPTEFQFSDPDGVYRGIGIAEYAPWDESQPEPKGKCMNCGDLSFYQRYACSPECSQELEWAYRA